MFSFFSRRTSKGPRPSRRVRPALEVLEDRTVPSGSTISGYVYEDANNNGLFDPGEKPIANSTIQLFNAQNQLIASTTSDATGFYKFDKDPTIDRTPQTLTKFLEFPSTQTDFILQGLIDQFDPALGELQSVEITHEGSITSVIKVENTSPISPSVIRGTVGGTIKLEAPGVTSTLDISENAGTFNATNYDGVKDYNGTSGHTFEAKTASGSKVITLTGAAMAPYIGTGKVTVTETAQASSYAAGGGNLEASLSSTGRSRVTVKYTYIPSDNLRPGNYTIVQNPQPAGYVDGKESSGGIVLGNPPGTDSIPIILGTTSLANNNFGELVTTGVSGYVYHDANNNGVKDPGESGIAGVQVTLTGTDIFGAITPRTAITNDLGFYQFMDLNPGTYQIQETQPNGWIDGKDTAGVLASNPNGPAVGTVTNDTIANIVLASGSKTINNNFGELQSTGISGYVFHDANNNGVKDPGEAGIAGALVTLTGADAFGNAIAPITVSTNDQGFYQFEGLAPGTYTVQQTQPSGWIDGKDAVGVPLSNPNLPPIGTLTNDRIANIVLTSGVKTINNNFGELKTGSLSGYVYLDANNNGIKDPGEQGIAGVQVTLTGTDSDGPVFVTVTTDANGFYIFQNLKPGTYTITETQPANYNDGLDTIGTPGGLAANDAFSNIVLSSGVNGVNNNFGERALSSLSGYVYVDRNNNGAKDPGEEGIAGVNVLLTGFDDQGPVVRTATTDASGFYQFTGLRVGTYAITETQPSSYKDGKDTAGSLGGTNAMNDIFADILVGISAAGVNYNFGELPPDVADLGILKTASASSVTVGSNLTYTLTITNYGTHTAQNVRVEDLLPVDAQIVSITGAGWTITNTTTKINALLPSLAVGATAQIFVTIKAPAVATSMVNTGTVTSDTPDNNPNNNTSTVTTTVINQPGDTFPKTIVPLTTHFGNVTIQGKLGLFTFDPTPYVDPTMRANMTFVDGLYRTALGRAASQAELQAGHQALLNGLSREQMIAQVWNSDEHRLYQANQFYQVFYNRNGTAAELAATANLLKAGMSEVDLALQFVTSAEYLASHSTSATLVGGLYQDILNRLPDLSTSILTVQALGNQSVSQVASSLLLSQEGLANMVDNGFRAVLRRAATASEIQFWVLQLQTRGVTPSQMMQQLLASAEFAQLAYNSTTMG